MSNFFEVSTFRQHLSTHWLGQDIRYFETLPSTNTYSKKVKNNEVNHGTLVLTDDQTAGRGQYDRSWEGGKGENLTFSIILRPQNRDGFHALTLSCALVLVELLNSMMNQNCACIKWPNDVLLNQKKVAGLLTETVYLGNSLARLIIGIGFNVNQRNFRKDLVSSATSIRLEKGEPVSREILLADLLGRIEYKYRLWQQKQTKLLRKINRNLQGYGRWVALQVDGKLLSNHYKLIGINEAGRLLVLNKEGGLQSYAYEQIRIITD